jgi:pimeloyl-ACP methyl ester carboxylesterase
VSLVLLHALPLDERMWDGHLDRLSDHGPVAPRLYGRGSTMDDWAASLLRELGEGPHVLVGASMGGYCALALADRAPERVRALVLVGSRADADSPERRASRADTIATIRDGGPAALWEVMSAKLFSDTAPPEAVARARAIALEQSPDALVGAVEAIRDRADHSDVARSLPLALVLGDGDSFVDPAYGAELVGSHGNASLTVIADCGHLPPLEQPDAFGSHLEEVLGRWT